MELENIQNKLELKYYKSILTSLSDNSTDVEWLNLHCEKLIMRINHEKDKISESQSQTQIDKKVEISNPIETENHKQIFSDENLYKKPWTKLNAIHKILKIKEFVNNLKINSEKERAELKDNLIELVKLKILTKKEKVSYDELNGKIISLIDLQYKNGKYLYPLQ
jgi:hypothetical protein